MYIIKTALQDNVINIARLKNTSTASTTGWSTTRGKKPYRQSYSAILMLRQQSITELQRLRTQFNQPRFRLRSSLLDKVPYTWKEWHTAKFLPLQAISSKTLRIIRFLIPGSTEELISHEQLDAARIVQKQPLHLNLKSSVPNSLVGFLSCKTSLFRFPDFFDKLSPSSLAVIRNPKRPQFLLGSGPKMLRRRSMRSWCPRGGRDEGRQGRRVEDAVMSAELRPPSGPGGTLAVPVAMAPPPRPFSEAPRRVPRPLLQYWETLLSFERLGTVWKPWEFRWRWQLSILLTCQPRQVAVTHSPSSVIIRGFIDEWHS